MARPVLDRRGFTLVELLVALMISGLLVGVIFQLMEGQGRYVAMQTSREEVQQNTRAAVDLIGSELRTAPRGPGIAMAAEDSIGIRATRFWGVVCVGTNGGSSVTLRMPAISGVGMDLNVGTSYAADVGGNPNLPEWTTAVRVTGIGAPLSNPPASCLVGTETTLPAGVEVRTLSLSSRPTNPNTGQESEPGDHAYVYDRVTYRTGPSSTGGDWIQRRLGTSSGARNQPLAGPVTPGRGLKFTYFSGAAVVPTPVSNAADRESIDRVMMVVETISRRQGDLQQTKADTVMISLRNRIP